MQSLSKVCPIIALLLTISYSTPTQARILLVEADPPLSGIKIDPPPMVGNNNQQVAKLLGFDERQGAEIASPGGLSADLPSGTVVLSGAIVSSHYIIFDPIQKTRITGKVIFDNNILGVITSRSLLIASDELAAPQTTYLSPNLRGLESTDVVTILDARTISIDLEAGNPGDYFRVITAPNGDYNHNGIVDAADFTVWRDTLGSSASLGADGNNSGVVDEGDYAVWRASFGSRVGNGSAESVVDAANVPEPDTAIPTFLTALSAACLRREKHEIGVARRTSSR
jgi:hypothetical protein